VESTRHGYNDSENFMTMSLTGEPPFKPDLNEPIKINCVWSAVGISCRDEIELNTC
jgi:hypothetical protein